MNVALFQSYSNGSRTLGLGIFFALVGLTGCDKPGEPSANKSVTSATDNRQKEPKVEFLAFTVKWCSVCKQVPKLLDELRAATPHVTFREIDADDPENKHLVEKYKPEANPFMFIVIDGEKVESIHGLHPFNYNHITLTDAIKAYKRKHQ